MACMPEICLADRGSGIQGKTELAQIRTTATTLHLGFGLYPRCSIMTGLCNWSKVTLEARELRGELHI